MSTVVRTLQDLTVEEHTLTVPLVWGDPTDHRTIDIFARVVDGYLANGAPVGSKTLALAGINLSPASIRNVMQDL